MSEALVMTLPPAAAPPTAPPRRALSPRLLPLGLGLPVAGWQIVFFAAPLAFLLVITFWKVENYRLVPAFSLANWERVLTSTPFQRALVHTFSVAGATTVLALILAFPAAYVIALRLGPRARDLAVAALIVPVFSSYILRVYAWQVLLSPEGVFNVALTALGLRFKDTAANIRDTEVFTVNIVSRAIAEAMHVTAVKFPPEVDELAEAGLTACPGVAVASPWIAEAPAAFECRRHVTLSLGRSREIILGEILHAHFAPGAVDDRLHVDPAALDAIARLGGDTCCTIRDRFDMPTPKFDEWRDRPPTEASPPWSPTNQAAADAGLRSVTS